MSVQILPGRREVLRGRRETSRGWVVTADDCDARSLAVLVFLALFQLYAVAQGNYAKSIWFGMFGLGVDGA